MSGGTEIRRGNYTHRVCINLDYLIFTSGSPSIILRFQLPQNMAFDSLPDPSIVHPALLTILGILTISFLVGFTSHSSLLRPAALPIILSYVYLIVSNSHLYTRGHWSGMLGGISCTYLFQYIDLSTESMGLYSKWTRQTYTQPNRLSRRPSNQYRRYRRVESKQGRRLILATASLWTFYRILVSSRE